METIINCGCGEALSVQWISLDELYKNVLAAGWKIERGHYVCPQCQEKK